MAVPTDKTLPAPDPRQRQIVQTYGAGRFRISDVEHTGPVLVTPERCFPWAVTGAEEIAPDNLAPLAGIDPRIEFLIVGCGPRAVFLPAPRRETLRAAGWAPEMMDTGAACRTYNVMLAEGRRVAVALIPLG
jgi:uncharacterized protein